MAKTKTAGLAKIEKPGALAPMEPWEMELASKAKQAQAAAVTGVPRIITKGGILKIDDKPVTGNKLQVVIAAVGRANVYFEKEYDSESSKGETPDCYAFGPFEPGAEEGMKPHVAAPHKQFEQCTGCQWNEFGSGKGNTKKCANTLKLLLYAPNQDPESLVKGQLRQISVPAGSLRNWGNYLSALEELTPYGYLGVVTEISSEPTEKAFRLTFRAAGTLEKPQVAALSAKIPSITRHLSEAFPTVKKEEEEAKPRRKVKGQ